jgi:hypothetical protein
MRQIEDVLKDLQSRTDKNSHNFYKPLEDEEERKLIHSYYRSKLTIPEAGSNVILSNSLGTKIASGYIRICTGDYGSYIEFNGSQAAHNNIEPRWNRIPPPGIKYMWMQTKDALRTKVYYQRGTVSYADYKVGYYYVDPKDIRLS